MARRNAICYILAVAYIAIMPIAARALLCHNTIVTNLSDRSCGIPDNTVIIP